jgi:hypothetical protein
MQIKINGHTIDFYSNIESLSILRFQKLNKYMMIASEVGNSFEDYDQRTKKTLEFMAAGMHQEAMIELQNRRQLVFNAFQEYDPKGEALAVLVKQIDDVFYGDELDTEKVLNHLDKIGITKVDSLNYLIELKKKVDTACQAYFPQLFQNSDLQENYLRIKRMQERIKGVINDSEPDVTELTKEILSQKKPHIWNVWETENMERAMEVDFNKMLIDVAKEKKISIKDMSVFTFYTAYQSIIESNGKRNSKV